jgi:uncharacterized protein
MSTSASSLTLASDRGGHFCWLLAALLVVFACSAVADVAVPPLRSRVTDLTNTLDAGQRAALEAKLAAFEKKKGSQIAVLIVPTTQPETIEQYGIRVGDAWKIGRKGVDDGVILIVAKNDRRLRLEVGYGLEGALPDAIAKRIVSDVITPYFRQGDFAGGINAGVDATIKVIDGEPLPAPAAQRASGSRGSQGFDFESLLIIGFIGVFVVGGILRAIFGRFAGSGVVAAVLGFIAWMLAGSLVVAVIVAIVAFILGLFAGAGSGGGGAGRGGGWSSGGGGFSSGGGGFSGGGGSFGGGGSSGSW